jgi:hypothetical protein
MPDILHQLKASRAIPIAALLFAIAAVAHAQDGAVRPLFADESTLRLRIEAPFARLADGGEERPELPGVVRFTDAAGQDVALDVEIRIRGKSRVDICTYPPLNLNFGRSQLDGTVFAGQNQLKLVTLCKHTDPYRTYLAQEHQIYRAYRALADESFRVRWLSVEFVETEGRRLSSYVEPAFLIEEDWEVAERHDLEVLEVASVELARLDPRKAALLALFQFMIGNWDWSIRAAPGESCCHNGKPLGNEAIVIILPYDFDQSGIIDAEYAQPRSYLNIRSVRQRVYRGYCAMNGELDWAIERMNERRAALERAFDSQPVAERARARAFDYVESFYELINDPKRIRRDIIDDCRR